MVQFIAGIDHELCISRNAYVCNSDFCCQGFDCDLAKERKKECMREREMKKMRGNASHAVGALKHCDSSYDIENVFRTDISNHARVSVLCSSVSKALG